MHRIFYLYPLVAVWVGYHLSTTIQSGKLWGIVFQSIACFFIIVATYFAYKCFYLRGKTDAYEEQIKRLIKNLK